jgi:hypothetical protein
MSLDSEVPPSKYLSSESRDTTKLLKHLAKKSASNHDYNTSQKFKSIVNNVQSCKEELLSNLADVEKNCEEKIATIADEVKTKSDEMQEMKKELNTKLEAMMTTVEAVTSAQVVPNTEKLKEVDVAVIELFKKMAYIESIVLNFSKSYYEMDDLKNLITKQSIDEKVSVTSNTANNTKNNESISKTTTNVIQNSFSTKPLPITMPNKVKELQGTPSSSLRNHTIGYEL